MNIKNIVWIFPFLSFLVGYSVIQLFFSQATITVPNIVGMPLVQAETIAASSQISLRLVKLQQDDHLAEGTILQQNPLAGSTIKKNHPISCVVSCKPPIQRAPILMGKNHDQIKQLSHENFSIRYCTVPHYAPKGQCIAQVPNPEQPIEKKVVIAYLSGGSSSLHIIPSLHSMTVEQATALLEEAGIPFSLSQSTSRKYSTFSSKKIVIDQRPYAGTIIDLAKPPLIQLQIETI